MKLFSQLLLGLTIVCLLIWQLPWCYNFLTARSTKAPFTLYSSVIGDFAMMTPSGDKGMLRSDLSGRTYTQAQFDSILPMFYFRQLMSDERFPDTLNGVPVTPRMAQMENFNFRVVPSDINAPISDFILCSKVCPAGWTYRCPMMFSVLREKELNLSAWLPIRWTKRKAGVLLRRWRRKDSIFLPPR